MDIELILEAPCPCQSGEILEKCCWSHGQFFPKGVKVNAPVSDNTNEKCYASKLNGCSEKQSLEHYISHDALKLFTLDTNGMIGIESKTLNKEIPVATFGSKVLCESHNSVLSPIDRCGTKFFAALHQVHSNFQSPSSDRQRRIVTGVNGYNLEQWLLKMLIGRACSINRNWQPPLRWLKILFGKRGMPQGEGLYCLAKPGQRLIVRDNKFVVSLLYDMDSEPNELVGLQANFGGIDFSLEMKTATSKEYCYRPSAICFTSAKDGTQQIVLMGWGPSHEIETVDLSWSPNS